MPVVSVRYEPNNSDFRKIMMSNDTAELAKNYAEDAMVLAKAYSPTSDRDDDHYRDHFSVESGGIVEIDGNPRRAARVVNDSEYAVEVEFGEEDSPKKRPQGGSRGAGSRPLGRAGARIGDMSKRPG